MKQRWSVRTYLWSLALAVALPCAAVLVYSIVSDERHDERQARTTTLALAQLIASQTQQFISDTENVLNKLATRPLVRALDPARRPVNFDSFLDLHPQDANLVLCNTTGLVLHSSLPLSVPLPEEAAVPEIRAKWAERIVRNKKFTIGEPLLGQISQKWVCVLGVPVQDADGEIGGALGLAVDLERFQAPTKLVSLPLNSLVTIVDEDGTVIARSVNPRAWVGRDGTSAEIVNYVLKHSEGSQQAHGLDGEERIYGFTTIPKVSWHVYVGIPTRFIFAAARENAWRAGLAGAALLALVIALVLVLASRINLPMSALFRATTAAAEGNLGTTVPTTGPKEISSVAESFNRMLIIRRQKEAEVEKLYREMEQRVKERTAELETANAELQREVQERKRAEQALTAHRQELQDYIDSMSTLNLKVSVEGAPLLVNKAAQQASGLSPEELMKANFVEGRWWAFDPQVQARVRAAFARACAGQAVNYDEKVFVFGKVIDVNFSLIPVRNAAGDVAFVIAEARDISALKQAEAVVADRSIQLEVANQELEAFAYSVSHDLRAPLRGIEGYTSALEEDHASNLNEEARGYLERIRAGVRRMSQLIEGLLNLSRVSRSEMVRSSVNLSALAEEIVSELKHSAPGRMVSAIVKPGMMVSGDRQLLRVALDNLLGNAWKFTAREPQARIEVGELNADGEAAYFVRDNGAGFDMAYRDKLFQVFQRLHSTKDFEGTGIGLATVQRIVRRHGGRIWCDGGVGKGATFYFTLPTGEFSI